MPLIFDIIQPTMKDYYYILGVSNEASEQEIRTAYKKLSMLFHPDKNGGDKFFEDRFKEIQEAYEMLGSPARREQYDAQLYASHRPPEKSTSFSTQPPVIRHFDSSKHSIQEGELITITWQVQNADSVHIAPLGLVETVGTKTIRLPNLAGKPLIKLTLTATNTFVQKTAERQIIIQNKTFRGKPQELLEAPQVVPPVADPVVVPPAAIVQEKPAEASLVVAKKTKSSLPSEPSSNPYAYLLMGVLTILAVFAAIAVYQLNQGR